MKKILALACSGALLWGCNNDLVVNAPYKNITIIYGLLSTKDKDSNPETVHFVKINKAFLGEGDAFLYALDPDSNEFQEGELQATVEEWSGDGTTLFNSYPLNDTLLDGRDVGVFYSPQQKLYYFTGNLNQDSQYKVVAHARGETVTAMTPIVNDFAINGPDQNPATAINFIVGSAFVNYTLDWTSSHDSRRFEVKYRFNYSEVRGTDTTHLSFTRAMGTVTTTTSNGGEEMSATIGGPDFYQSIANLIPEDPTVTKRIFRGIDFLFAVAGEDFNTYLALSEPISGIVEDRPAFTNVENGYGLFSSRYFKQVIGKKLGDLSLNELLNGEYTGGMLWCAAQSSGPPYGCD